MFSRGFPNAAHSRRHSTFDEWLEINQAWGFTRCLRDEKGTAPRFEIQSQGSPRVKGHKYYKEAVQFGLNLGAAQFFLDFRY